ncbi:protein FAM227A-like isoform X2 [Polypterus senegalus]|uniref:protein FAM227A-like isoform X2 n=1 Tax=Polypterus senegalus TaxID=55291 RepID=UPI001966376F|nr:protein FAM227A-like isoform X2 [Polypterus senegalus]
MTRSSESRFVVQVETLFNSRIFKSMDHINGVCSPMEMFEEDTDQSTSSSRRRWSHSLDEIQPIPACLIGSIEKVNKKMADPGLKLHRYCRPVGVSLYGDNSGTLLKILNVNSNVTHEDKPHEPNRKASDISHLLQSNISLPEHGTKPDTEEAKGSSHHMSMTTDEKPKLVELQHYPGFSETEPTSLPTGVHIDEVIERVVAAQTRPKKKKPKYLKEFKNLLTSQAFRCILLDSFWWVFLHNYQPNEETAKKLFSRTSENYVNLLVLCRSFTHGDVFLKGFAYTLSQALYCCFCHCFPQSWRQFCSKDFLFHLCDISFQWTTGIHPSPGVINGWNLQALEPASVLKERMLPGSDTSRRKPGHIRIKTNSDVSVLHYHNEEKTSKSITKPWSIFPATKFQRSTFNICGHSPLMQHYLRSQKADMKAGMDVLLQRTEIVQDYSFRKTVRQSEHSQASEEKWMSERPVF